ncbi:MAG: hypothetical protein P8Y75_10430 [Nitrospirota bacterium]
MLIDAREQDVRETLRRIKEIFQEECSVDVSLDVYVTSREEARKVGAFTAMTGCKTEYRKEDGCNALHISGGSCRCG